MMRPLIIFLVLVIAIEAITEIVTKSEIFKPLRQLFFNLGMKHKPFMWFHDLLDCGYCFSVWVSFFMSIVFISSISLPLSFINWFIASMLMHRLSNMFHNIMDRIMR